MNFSARNWELDIEMLTQALKLDAKICEVEISFTPRKFGKSKTGLFSTGTNLILGAMKEKIKTQ